MSFGEFRAKEPKISLVLHIPANRVERFRVLLQAYIVDPEFPQELKDFLTDTYLYLRDKT